jgi:hypothetical protein
MADGVQEIAPIPNRPRSAIKVQEPPGRDSGRAGVTAVGQRRRVVTAITEDLCCDRVGAKPFIKRWERESRMPYRMKLVATMLLSFFLTNACLGAESASTAIKTFGLVGTWSGNCRAKVKGAFRSTWALSESFGDPTLKIIAMNDARINYEVLNEIREAARIADDYIKIILAITKISGQLPIALPWAEGDIWEMVIMKIDNNKYRTLSSATLDEKKISIRDGFIYRQSDGRAEDTNVESGINERCSN